MAETDTRKADLAKMEGELKEVQTQVKKWVKLIDESETAPASAMAKLNAYETKEGALKRQIESLSATIHDNPLTGWRQVEPTIDNRLRLQAVLANEIETISIDANERTAKLTLKDGKTTFDLAWEFSGSNGAKKDAGSERYLMFGEPQAYLDQVLIWKSDQNINLVGRKIQIVDTDTAVVCGVEIEPNTIAIAAR